jgi:hypothetical protein
LLLKKRGILDLLLFHLQGCGPGCDRHWANAVFGAALATLKAQSEEGRHAGKGGHYQHK